MISKKQLETLQLTHKHGGNGFVMVEDIDNEYCRVVAHGGTGKLDWLVRLAAKDRLSFETVRELQEVRPGVSEWRDAGKPLAIPTETMAKLTEIRSAIITGTMKVEKNRLVKV